MNASGVTTASAVVFCNRPPRVHAHAFAHLAPLSPVRATTTEVATRGTRQHHEYYEGETSPTRPSKPALHLRVYEIRLVGLIKSLGQQHGESALEKDERISLIHLHDSGA